ncbi:MAG: phasin family protein [Polynucleobacter sp.]|nr:phasin family protein [Polynucleobacter sp.]
MNQKEIQEWQQKKAKELFALSHKLLDTAKQLSEHHANELKHNMEHALRFAKSAAKNDLEHLKELQEEATKAAAQRMADYQKKVKSMLREMGDDAADEAEKYLEKARSSLSTWLEEVEKKMPAGGEHLAKVARDLSSAGAKAFKEGRRVINEAAEVAEKNIGKMSSRSTTASPKKKTAPKKAAAKKSAAKKTPAKKAASKKSID